MAENAATDIMVPLLLSLRVAGLATFFSFVFGVGLAWVMSRRRGPVRSVIDALCTLPMVLPPTVLGYYLILFVGRRGVLGPWLAEFGISLMFSWQGAVAAATVVVFPLIYKSARAALESVDHTLEDAARTLGVSEWAVFMRVSLPLAWRGCSREPCWLSRGYGGIRGHVDDRGQHTRQDANPGPGHLRRVSGGQRRAGDPAGARHLGPLHGGAGGRGMAAGRKGTTNMIDMSVRKRMGNAGSDFELAVELHLPEDSRCAVLFGPSGSGKTLTLRVLAGLLRPDAGFIRLAGETLFDAVAGVDVPCANGV